MRKANGRDPERTKRRILASATQEFARYGLGGARVDRIARGADTNKRMLYYYFGDKEGLFLAALEDRYAHIRNAERGLQLEHLEPREALKRLVQFTWNYFLEHPEFLTLLNSENLHKGRHLKDSARVREMHSTLVATLRTVLRRGEAQGLFRKGVPWMHRKSCRTCMVISSVCAKSSATWSTMHIITPLRTERSPCKSILPTAVVKCRWM